MTPIAEIESDLDWREAELASLRIMLTASAISAREKTVLFRAAWTLLYAHYEGFCKFALTVYYDNIRKSGKLCEDLPLSVQIFSLGKTLKKLKNMSDSDALSAVQGFDATHLKSPASFPDVETNSNLWPAQLEKLLEHADLSLPSLPLNNQKLSTLVRRRNKIAHGERDIIKEVKYYLDFESSVKIVIYELVFAIDDKLKAL